MNHYIFLERVTGSGGVQCYLAAMTQYLEQNGWHVVVISDNNPRNKDERCLITTLEKYSSIGIPLTTLHPHELPLFVVNRVIDKMINRIGEVKEGDEVIIESWNSPTSLWGELLASRVKGRHFFWTANEIYRGEDRAYLDKIDFYLYKYKRREIFAILATINKLFEGISGFVNYGIKECVITEAPIQDVDNSIISSINKKDWNICHIGRANKPYVPNIINGVAEFASKHTDKQLQLIMVGNADACRTNLDSIAVPNLSVLELGDLYPIPRKLFEKVDVVIAGSGSARHSADEGTLTIIADSETCDSRGLLGYDTLNSVYETGESQNKEDHFSFADALERALVLQTWKGKTNRWVPSPGIKECWENHQTIIDEAEKEKEYFNLKELLKGKKNYKGLFKMVIKDLMIRFHLQ